ncbi:hypothetical protein HNQ80_004898 [Anaerosolibacter carboniphilus]|uniref:Uncharacterized protein n=1 Tax=Anaerosolibacter carboniphilus TaxID=1417629 RepID=A0A841KZH7_9FIRM|nr:hypothetical protein [Anaerosolibacter carboniphilus]MBB6218723.1 hypothetical protein [Anaerosolibacter carboniphilus]
MKNFKYVFSILILFYLLTNFYQNYIYYKIPYNPLVEFTKDTPRGFHFSKNHPNNSINKSSHNLDTNTLIFKYFSDLNLIPLKEKAHWNEIHKHEKEIYFSGMFEFVPPANNKIFIDEIYLDNLTIIAIRSDKRGFHDGYYKIIGSKFDYKYINDLITNSQKL